MEILIALRSDRPMADLNVRPCCLRQLAYLNRLINRSIHKPTFGFVIMFPVVRKNLIL